MLWRKNRGDSSPMTDACKLERASFTELYLAIMLLSLTASQPVKNIHLHVMLHTKALWQWSAIVATGAKGIARLCLNCFTE